MFKQVRINFEYNASRHEKSYFLDFGQKMLQLCIHATLLVL